MKKNFVVLFVIAVVALFFSACPEVTTTEEADPRLVGSWRNYKTGDTISENLKKDFTINADRATFTCRINPGKEPNYQGWGNVTGVLTTTSDKGIYTMTRLEGTAEPADPLPVWPQVVGGFSSQKVKITFVDDDTFDFESGQGTDAVTEYFGGRYYKVSE